MKTIFRLFKMGLLLSGIVAAGATTSLAQDPCADVDGQTAVYTKFTESYPLTTIAGQKAAIEAGKQFLEKYGACETVKEQADYLKGAVPKMEAAVKKREEGEKMSALFKRFDAGLTSTTPDDAYAAGKEILAAQPDNLNIIIPLGVVGLYQSYNKNFKYNDDTVRYANMAISALKAGKEPTKPNKKYGALQYEYTKEDALSELTYAVGYINFYAKNDKKAALPFYYEVSQMAGKNKNEPRVYATIGSYYVDEAAPLGKEIADLILLQKGTGTDDEKASREVVIKAKVGLFNGYAERALDAFGRAHKAAVAITPDTPANKTLKEGLYKQLQTLYERRFEKKDGLDTYIATTVAKPMPNPTSPVTPVADPEPTTTTTTTTGAAAAPTTPVKPAPVNGTKTATAKKPRR